VKNQYFGDNRDLFKYDLVQQIIEKRLAHHFTFIPMLTKNDDTKQGDERNREKAKAGRKNRDLIEFLNRFNNKSERDIRHLDVWFKKQNIKIETFRDYFYNAERVKYFQEARRRLLPESVICVDPDKGLQIKKSGKEHILYCEVKMLYDRMDKSSILMIFQYRPRMEKWKDCCRRISEQLKKEVGNSPIYISDDPSVFFFLTKENESLRESLSRVIKKYREVYHLK
jgi:hypothetical protein